MRARPVWFKPRRPADQGNRVNAVPVVIASEAKQSPSMGIAASLRSSQ
jgi:hypothetical protein